MINHLAYLYFFCTFANELITGVQAQVTLSHIDCAVNAIFTFMLRLCCIQAYIFVSGKAIQA